MTLAAIPSPTQSVWHLGPLPLRAYALCIVAGIFVALAITSRRWRARGGEDDDMWDISFLAIVLGIVGGRLYHVITDWQKYFGSGENPADALRIWDGGLGIWGAIALGGVGAWIGCRRKNVRLTVYADAAAPGVLAAQAIGRWGNWFNNELYGRATDLPWKLQIHCLDLTEGRAVPGGIASGGQTCPPESTVAGYFHPTFLYESLWSAAVVGLLLFLDRRYRIGRGNVFALYVMGYCAGRFWIEMLRIDEAHKILGVRLNVFTAVIVFVGALVWFLRHGGINAPRELTVNQRRRRGRAGKPADTDDDEHDAPADDAATDEAADGDETTDDARPDEESAEAER